MKHSENKIIRADDFACLFNKSYSNVANVFKVIYEFKANGFCPINHNIFGEEEQFLYEDHVQKDNQSVAEAKWDATIFLTNQSSISLSEALVPLSPQPSRPTFSTTNSVLLDPRPSCSSDRPITRSVPIAVEVAIPFEKISPGPISQSAVKAKERKNNDPKF